MEKLDLSPEQLEQFKKYLEQRDKIKQIPRTKEDAEKHEYKFWSKQPVTQLNEFVANDSQIREIDPNTVPKEVSKIPEDFVWCSIDLTDEAVCQEVADFLDSYYVEDDFGEFRLHYSKEFVRWACVSQNYNPELTLGIRVAKTSRLVAFIAGIPKDIQVNRQQLKCLEVNFLCIHTKLRFKRLASVMIGELTRRGHLNGYTQAFYTAARYLPTPFVSARYQHRAINIETLLDTGFTALQGETTVEEVKKGLQLPEKISTPNFKPMEDKHINGCLELLNEYFRKYNVHPVFNEQTFRKIFWNNQFVTAYVLEDDEGELVDMISYYTLPSRVLKKNAKHAFIKEAYLFYYTSLNETPYRLIKDILVVARDNGMDVFNLLEIMENKTVLGDLQFEKGTGTLHYYLYNWKTKSINQEQVALVPF